MKYEGKVYGKIAGKFIEVDQSEEIEAMAFMEKYGEIVKAIKLAAMHSGLSVEGVPENEFQTTYKITLHTKNRDLVERLDQLAGELAEKMSNK